MSPQPSDYGPCGLGPHPLGSLPLLLLKELLLLLLLLLLLQHRLLQQHLLLLLAQQGALNSGGPGEHRDRGPHGSPH